MMSSAEERGYDEPTTSTAADTTVGDETSSEGDAPLVQLRERVRRLTSQLRHMQGSLHSMQTTVLTIAQEESSKRSWLVHKAYPKVLTALEKPDPTADLSASSQREADLQTQLYVATISPLISSLKSFEAARRFA